MTSRDGRTGAVRVTLVDATGQPDPASARDVEPPATPETASETGFGGPSAPAVAGHGPPTVALLSPRRGVRRLEVVVDGWRFELEVEDADRAALRRRATREPDAVTTSEPMEIRAIIPGRVGSVRVAPGDEVAAGDTLLVVEAMKMQNELRAARAGSVERVAVGEGQTIEIGDLLVVIA